MKTTSVQPFVIADQTIQSGHQLELDLPISAMSNRQTMSLPVKVYHGAKPGPVLFVSAAIHGDEIIGVEIIRRLSKRPSLKQLAGTLLLVPIVNGYGFLNRSRYLPDRRDLNRSFPGSETGSLAARLAHLFLDEIVERSDYGIDLHSAAIHRENLPQIRVTSEDDKLLALAKTFGAPATIISSIRDGSLREAASERGVPVLLFEGGEGLRFDETAVRAGLAGILRVMSSIGMLPKKANQPPSITSFVSSKSNWVRAPEGGLLQLKKRLGATVEPGDRIGVVTDIFDEEQYEIFSEHAGIVIGRSTLPIVNEGDAIMHIARAAEAEIAGERVEAFVDHLALAPMFYEDEII